MALNTFAFASRQVLFSRALSTTTVAASLKAKVLGVDCAVDSYNKIADAIESGKYKQHLSPFTAFYDPNLDGYKTWATDAKYRQETLDALPEEDRHIYVETEGMPHALARHHMKVIDLFKRLNIPKDQWDASLAKWNVSSGYETLEWTLPSPPPFHCFDELPIIKQH